MKKYTTIEQIISIAAEVFSIPKEEISKDLRVGMIEPWDSLGHLTLFMAIQEQLKIKFTTDEIIRLVSLGAIATCVETKKNSQGGAP